MRILLCALVILASGCSSEQRIIKYYTFDGNRLSPPPDTVVYVPESFPYAAAVGRFTIAGPYNQNRIALRTGTNELQYYYYHHWADLPAPAATISVWQQIKRSGVFRSCEMHLYDVLPDFEIMGTIHRIERLDYEGRGGAHLSMTMELFDVRAERVAVTHSFDETADLGTREAMNSFAREISRLLHEETNQFILKINQYLAHRQP